MSNETEQDVAELRAGIADTREDMSRTIEQLEEKLNPATVQSQATDLVQQMTDQLLAEFETKFGDISGKISEQLEAALHNATSTKIDQLLGQLSSTASGFGGTAWGRLAQNPAPVALAALGIGLLAAEGSHLKSAMTSGNGAEAAESGVSVKQSIADQSNGARDIAASFGDQAGSLASSLGEQAAKAPQMVSAAPAAVKEALGDHTLLPGLLALGFGIVAGLAIPATGDERQTATAMRDRVSKGLDQLGVTDSSGQGRGLIDQMKSNATDLTAQAADTLKGAGADMREVASTIGTDAVSTAKQGVRGS